MEYKTIVVHLDASPRRMERLELALRLAAQRNGHLIGLFALDPIPMPRYAAPDWSNALVDAAEQEVEAACDETRTAFEAACAKYPDLSVEWRAGSDGTLGAAEAVELSARYADLVIAGQHERDAPEAGRVTARFAEDLVMQLARPLLMIPYAGHYPGPFRRVLLAWDGSAQAMRAATGALPLLIKADEVQVTAFDAEKHPFAHGQQPGADATLYLARHGVKAVAARHHSVGGNVGSAILSRAADMGADLIVMGAYGHSRAKERILGGATRTIFESMTMPVLMSH